MVRFILFLLLCLLLRPRGGDEVL